MQKRIISVICLVLLGTCLAACGGAKPPSIGVSFGVGNAARWEKEKEYMEELAAESGAEIEIRLNKTDEPKTQEEDCKELIDSGIDVLILTPRDVTDVSGILEYAKEKDVPVIDYARAILGHDVKLFVGYDSSRIGQKMGQYLTEMVYEGDYIILRGDENDNNAALLYEGAMRYIDSNKDNINILLDASVAGWDPAVAKQMVLDAVSANGNKVDAILAPNDMLAGACAEALAELGVTDHVVITGMDAELDAAKRIAAGTQDATVYMDLQELASMAVEQAIHVAKGEKVEVNAEFDNQNGEPIDANLITGQLITKDNLDKILIDSGYFTKEEVYGGSSPIR